jgi:CDP-glycerol glycerophosphotransferase (TagB/SpsB family)
MIGDYSSIIAEFSALNRPIVFSSRKNRFINKTNFKRYAAACSAAKTLNQLPAAVAEELKSPQKRSAGRQELANRFVWNLGNAAQTVAEEIFKRI